VAHATFILLVIALTFILLLGRFVDVQRYFNMDYMLAIILATGLFSILPLRRTR
jgi:hypothetical protein